MVSSAHSSLWLRGTTSFQWSTSRRIARTSRLTYTRSVTPMQRLRQSCPHVLLALFAVVVIGCAGARPIPSSPPALRSGQAELSAELGQPTRETEPRPRSDHPTPTPTPWTGSLTFTDADLQYWSNPNDISGLVRQGDVIWAATPGGVVRWTSDGRHRLYTDNDGLVSQAILGIALDSDGHPWVGYADGGAWSEYDGRTWHTYTWREDAVELRYEAMRNARHFDPRLWVSRSESGWVWLPTKNGQLKAYDGQRWRTYGEYEGVTRGTWLVDVSASGRVWAVGSGLSTAEEGGRWWDDRTLFSSIAGREWITGIAADSGGVWLSYRGPRDRGGGVCRFDWGDNRWQGHMHDLNPLVPTQVHDVSVTPGDVVWVSGADSLVYREPQRPWTGLLKGEFEVQSFVLGPQGEVWLGSADGLWHADRGGTILGRPWRVPSPSLGSEVRALTRDRSGSIWVATPHGVTHISSDGATAVVLDGEALCLASSINGQVWAGTPTGLYKVGEGKAPGRVLGEPIVALDVDSEERTWACTDSGRVQTVADEGAQIVLELRDHLSVLPRDMAVDSTGTAWFATELGLGILAPDGEFRLATVEDGLLSEDVRAVAVGPDDAVWMATARGLARRLPTGRWTRFTTESTGGGLRSMGMWDVHVDPDGVLWMATDAGISRRTPETDWSYYDLPGVRHVLPGPGSDAIWVGSPNGLYRLRGHVLIAVP